MVEFAILSVPPASTRIPPPDAPLVVLRATVDSRRVSSAIDRTWMPAPPSSPSLPAIVEFTTTPTAPPSTNRPRLLLAMVDRVTVSRPDDAVKIPVPPLPVTRERFTVTPPFPSSRMPIAPLPSILLR